MNKATYRSKGLFWADSSGSLESIPVGKHGSRIGSRHSMLGLPILKCVYLRVGGIYATARV